MADKKRKGAASVPAQPTKKTKKTPASEPAISHVPVNSKAATESLKANDAVTKSRASRKRAADFLGDDDQPAVSTVAPVETTKAGKKAKKANPSSLTADGVNGVIEHKNTAKREIASAKNQPDTSLEAEGLRTADKELEEEDASDDDDQGAALLAGFDSDSDDPAEDQGDMSRTQPIPQFKKTSKKLKLAKEKGSDGPGTVYVGRIPHGFYEQQMRDYFSQFGDIARLRLSRNKRTGASKHFAFIEFASDEVAKIVAETMDNYLMFGHILKCKYAPSENLHPEVWKGANKKYRKIPHDKLQRQQLEAPKTQEQWAKKNEKENRKRVQRAEKLKAIGYEYVVPQLKNPSDVIEHRKAEKAKAISDATLMSSDEPPAIEAAPLVPADEVALKKEKKTKKSKSEGTRELLTEANLDARNAGPAAESAKITQNESDKKNKAVSVDTAPEASIAPPKKSKKTLKSGSSIVESNGNRYDNLSSIDIGIEAAPASVTDAMPPPEMESISTYDGVADAVLAGRKLDRKNDRKHAKGRKSTKAEQAEAEVSQIAPGAVSSGKKEKEKQLKGILKKSKKA